LPPAYRAFLLLSEGAYAQPGWGYPFLPLRTSDPDEPQSLGLLDAAHVGWLRDDDTITYEIWGFAADVLAVSVAHPLFDRRVPEAEYLDHARESDPMNAKLGHLRYALQVSGNVNNNIVMLNPLVVDAAGEWEAWDFGVSILGPNRHRSFLELLAADVRNIEDELSRPSWRVAQERRDAAAALEPVDELAGTLLDTSADVSERQAAAGKLGMRDEPAALEALIAAAGDPEPRIQAAVIPSLASRDDPEVRRAAVAILTAPGVEDFVIHSVPTAAKDAVWEAWQEQPDPRLLGHLAFLVDERALPAIAAAIGDASVPGSIRASLATYGWWWQRLGDPDVLVAAAEAPGAPHVQLGDALARLGATDDAAAVLARGLETEMWRSAAEQLGRLASPRALDALLERFEREPAAEVALALGSYDDPRASDALVAAAGRLELQLAVVDGLEKIRAADALADLSASGDLLATRALAPLLAALSSDDADIAFEGADGLRDLHSPAAAPALLAAAERGGDHDVRAAAAHALVTMGAPEARAATAALAASDSEALRRLAEIWS
jgi:HEAT repeat protein